MRIIVPNSYISELIDYILSTKDVETHCFLFGGFSKTKITVGRLWKTPYAMYTCRSSVKVELKREYIIKALEYARKNKFALIDVHSHPWMEEVNFSSVDDEYGLKNARWIEQKYKEGVFPKVPWGMMVISGGKRIKARIYDFSTDSFIPADVHTPLDFSQEEDGKISEISDRQIKLWKEEGQRKLAKAKVAIIGVGGLGSLLCEYLARMGVKRFCLIDGDKVESTNLNRLAGFYPEHIGFFKVDIAAMNIRRIVGPDASISIIHDFLKRENLHLLSNCDLLVGAVDREGARLLINEVAVRYLIPYIDIGTGIKVNKDTVIQIGGQIRFINPGTTPCLSCYANGIDPFEAALDLIPQNDIQVRRQLGYIEGTNLSPEPSVVSLNGILASLASQEISKLIIGFHHIFSYISYDGLINKIKLLDEKIDLKPQRNCPVCGVGGLLGLGELEKQTYILVEEQKELQNLLNQ